MSRFFYILAYVPYLFACLLGLRAVLVDTSAGVQTYRGLITGYSRYVAVRAKKPFKAESYT